MLMLYAEFVKSLEYAEPPVPLSPALKALWYAHHDQWSVAHELIDSLHDPVSCWVHAYLHRWEGDQWNAQYWYRRANQPVCKTSLQKEWEQLVRALTTH